jgi:hypothetical protein
MRVSIRHLLRLAAIAGALPPWSAQAQSGLITKATELEPITLASGKPLAAAPYELEAGKYYRIDINADGSAELAIGGPEFFRNAWVNEIVINDIEVRPLGVDSIEFDDEGTATISFIMIRPGMFTLRIPGTTGGTQAATFNVK